MPRTKLVARSTCGTGPPSRWLKRTVGCQNIPARRQNTPASTSVLMNPALLEQIILQLDGLFDGWGPAQQERNQALLWAAQTSKALFQPAINALWRTLSSLLPLLGILPQFRQLGKYYTLVGQISDKDWSRFNMYSRYVRVFKCRELQDAVGKDVYIQIARLHPKTLFPLLKEIEISTISDDFAENLGPLFHCLTPSLTSVTIRNIEGERGEMLATSFISALCCESIGLCDLSIDARISSEAVNCLDNIDGLRSLKLFMNSSITNIEKLIGLSAADLTVEFGRKGMVMKGHQRASNRLPLDIKALRVIGTNEQIDQVFDILELSFLEDIKLEILDPAATINPAPWRCIPPNLTALTIEAHIVKGKLPVISLRDLKLVDSSKLVTLSLKNLSLRATHDDFLDVFASGQGKNLRYLCLPYISDIDLPSSPSIEILGEMGHWCPKLLKLLICVDLRLSDEKSIQKALKSMQTSSHGLMELNIQSIVPPKHNGFHQSVLLARYIDALFPELEYLGAYDNLDENQKDYWAGIGEAVKWSHEMRRMSN